VALNIPQVLRVLCVNTVTEKNQVHIAFNVLKLLDSFEDIAT